MLIRTDNNICTKRNYKANLETNGVIKFEKAVVTFLSHPNNSYNNK